MRYRDQTLLIDADDTLWETNIQFERVTEAFAALVAPFGHEPEVVRDTVDRTERKNIGERGYGMRNFLMSLEEAFQSLAGRPPHDDEAGEIQLMGRFFEQPKLIEGVPETLAYLAERHHLHLFSKGDQDEQAGKFDGSGLQYRFNGWDIVPEKDATAYRQVVSKHNWKPSEVWMIGNSPRSDINPALEIGLNAVYIPAAISWSFEEEDIRPGRGTLLRLKSFAELRDRF